MATASINFLRRGKIATVNLREYPTVLHLKQDLSESDRIFPSLQGIPLEWLQLSKEKGEILSDSTSLESCGEVMLYLKILQPLPRCPSCDRAFPANNVALSRHYPILLQCGHSICDQCVNPTGNFLGGTQPLFTMITCAVGACKRVTYLIAGTTGIELARNEPLMAFAQDCFTLNEQRENYVGSTIPQCCGCKTVEAEMGCESCQNFMCQECSDSAHKTFPVVHDRYWIRDIRYVSRPPPACKTHSNISTYFCSCKNEFLCDECRMSDDHNVHKALSVKQYMDALTSSLRSEAEDLRRSRERLHNESDAINQAIIQAKENLVSSNRRIAQLFRDFIRRLEELRDNRVQENTLQFTQLVQALVEKRASLTPCLSSLIVGEEERELAARQLSHEVIHHSLALKVPFQDTIRSASQLLVQTPPYYCREVSVPSNSDFANFMNELFVLWKPVLSVDTTSQTSLAKISWQPFGSGAGVNNYSLELRVVDKLGVMQSTAVRYTTKKCCIAFPLLPFSDYEVKMTNITANGHVISVNYPSSNRWKTSGKNEFVSKESAPEKRTIYMGVSRIDGSIVPKTGSKEIGFWEGKLTFPPTNAIAVGLLCDSLFEKAKIQKLKRGYCLETNLMLANSSFTVSCLISIDSFPSNQDDLPILGQDKNPSSDCCLHLVIRKKKAFFSFYGNDTAGRTELVPCQWYHLIFSYNMKTRKRFIYLNGCLDGSTEGVTPLQSREKIFVSCYRDNKGFEGNLNDLTVWDGCVEDEGSVKALYHNRVCGLPILGQPLHHSKIDSSVSKQVKSNGNRDVPGLFLRNNGEIITSSPAGVVNEPDASRAYQPGDTVGVLVDCRKEPTVTFYRNRSVVVANVPLSANLFEIPIQPAVWSMSLSSSSLERTKEPTFEMN